LGREILKEAEPIFSKKDSSSLGIGGSEYPDHQNHSKNFEPHGGERGLLESLAAKETTFRRWTNAPSKNFGGAHPDTTNKKREDVPESHMDQRGIAVIMNNKNSPNQKSFISHRNGGSKREFPPERNCSQTGSATTVRRTAKQKEGSSSGWAAPSATHSPPVLRGKVQRYEGNSTSIRIGASPVT